MVSMFSTRNLLVLLVYPDEHSCDETNINFKLRVNGDILRENAVKPNDVLICSAELKSASDVFLPPHKTNSNSSVLVSPVKTNLNVYWSSTGVQVYNSSTGVVQGHRGLVEVQVYNGYSISTMSQDYRSSTEEYNGYRGSTVVQGFRRSTGLGIQGSTVLLGYCRASRVVQEYTGKGVVQLHSSNTGLQGTRCSKGVQEGTGKTQYRDAELVPRYRCTGVVQGYRDTIIVHVCMGRGMLQGGTRVLQWYRDTGVLEEHWCSIVVLL
ncbi:hypothetical protein HN011_004267 [Eciton burchellii]|nr:hypothetical protein HN011_004267 [Eciton burchellii]